MDDGVTLIDAWAESLKRGGPYKTKVALALARNQDMTTRKMADRIRALEDAASERSGVRVLTRPADLEGEALAEWEARYLRVPHCMALTVIIRQF